MGVGKQIHEFLNSIDNYFLNSHNSYFTKFGKLLGKLITLIYRTLQC